MDSPVTAMGWRAEVSRTDRPKIKWWRGWRSDRENRKT